MGENIKILISIFVSFLSDFLCTYYSVCNIHMVWLLMYVYIYVHTWGYMLMGAALPECLPYFWRSVLMIMKFLGWRIGVWISFSRGTSRWRTEWVLRRPWWSSGYDSVLSMKRVPVQSLVRELRFCKPHSTAKKKKSNRAVFSVNWLRTSLCWCLTDADGT